ncbi:hypothetical protein C2S51_029874 [Perilla frutescens var. frutescens]|nr:hypothetical protein C2S51_029874 [Perilla frutescens var. frutescens]
MSDEDIFITIKMPEPFNDFVLEVGASDTIQQLKVKIQEAVGDPLGPIQIRNEIIDLVLPNFMTLHELSISANLAVTVEFQPDMSPETSSQPPAPPTPTPQSEGRRMITVMLKYGETTIPVKVRVAHNVSELKTMLKNAVISQILPEAYFFIHNQCLMEEKFSLTWHKVAEGDVIQIFEGRLSTVMSFQLKRDITVEASSDNTIHQLKEKICIKEGIPVSRISIKNANGVDLPDDKTLQDCKISSNSRITVEFLPESSQPVQPPRSNEICVVLQYKERMVMVDVTAAHTVRQLRTQLQEGMNMNLQLPEDYFFMRKNAVMGEETSFESQNVARGDVIQIFEGRVERGGGS